MTDEQTPTPSVDWAQISHDFLGNLPHPLAPSIKSADYPTAARLAAATAHSSRITPPAVEAFWGEFNALNKGLGDRAMSPDQYTAALKNIAPLSYVFHGRPPTMAEIGQMHDAAPDKVRSYYYNLPDQNYPDVPAGDMVKALQSAQPFSRLYLGRDPVKNEAQFLFHSGQDPQAHYQFLGQLQKQGPEALGGVSIAPRSPGTVPTGGFGWGAGREGEGTSGVRPGVNAPEGNLGSQGPRPAPAPWVQGPQSGGQATGVQQ